MLQMFAWRTEWEEVQNCHLGLRCFVGFFEKKEKTWRSKKRNLFYFSSEVYKTICELGSLFSNPPGGTGQASASGNVSHAALHAHDPALNTHSPCSRAIHIQNLRSVVLPQGNRNIVEASLVLILIRFFLFLHFRLFAFTTPWSSGEKQKKSKIERKEHTGLREEEILCPIRDIGIQVVLRGCSTQRRHVCSASPTHARSSSFATSLSSPSVSFVSSFFRCPLPFSFYFRSVNQRLGPGDRAYVSRSSIVYELCVSHGQDAKHCKPDCYQRKAPSRLDVSRQHRNRWTFFALFDPSHLNTFEILCKNSKFEK